MIIKDGGDNKSRTEENINKRLKQIINQGRGNNKYSTDTDN
jgi:hypothetical protein